jgi:peroxiredoxin
MVAMFWLLGFALVPAQVTPRSAPTPVADDRIADRALTPHLGRGQELVYRGSFTEQATGRSVQFQRAYRFETRFFILDTPPRGVSLAAFTALQDRTARPTPGIRAQPISTSVRLERLSIDLQGKVVSDSAVSLTLPLEGPPTLEVGAFLEVPRGRMAINQGWEVMEMGRPAIAWRIAGREAVNGQNCIKVVGLQQTDDWDRPRADRGSWRRQETVWVTTRTGISARVERIIEHREPACRETTLRSVLRYDLESHMSLPGQLAQDRRQEILQTLGLRESAMPLLVAPTGHAKQLDGLARKITYHLENHPTTPYREALLLLGRQVEAGRRGEVLPVVQLEPSRPTVATIGQPAPDFVASECTGTGSGRLARWKGKPILLVFYHPASYTANEVLRFAQDIHTTWSRQAAVVGMTVLDDTTTVLKQRTALKLGFPIFHGGGLRISYEVDTTPRLVLIDAHGVVRGSWMGWGQETSSEILAEMRRWIPLK